MPDGSNSNLAEVSGDLYLRGRSVICPALFCPDIRRERLLHTARDVLPFIKQEHFDMTEWKCGSVCCAFGAEADTKYAHERGLRLVYAKRIFSMQESNAIPVLVEGEETYDRIWAAMQYYGITENVADWLFGPEWYQLPTTTAIVIHRIEEVLEANS